MVCILLCTAVSWCTRIASPKPCILSIALPLAKWPYVCTPSAQRIPSNSRAVLDCYSAVKSAGAVAEENGLEDIKTDDWSDNVAPFWGEVVESAVTPSGISGLLTAGWDTLKGAMVMPMMQHGYSIGLIKFVAITGTVVSGPPDSATNEAGSTAEA